MEIQSGGGTARQSLLFLLSFSGSASRHHINSAAPAFLGGMIVGKEEPGMTDTCKTAVPGKCAQDCLSVILRCTRC